MRDRDLAHRATPTMLDAAKAPTAAAISRCVILRNSRVHSPTIRWAPLKTLSLKFQCRLTVHCAALSALSACSADPEIIITSYHHTFLVAAVVIRMVIRHHHRRNLLRAGDLGLCLGDCSSSCCSWWRWWVYTPREIGRYPTARTQKIASHASNCRYGIMDERMGRKGC